MLRILRAATGLGLLLAVGLTVGVRPATAKTYAAERFDSHVRVMHGGTLEVTETVVFQFESGTFDHVVREIPARRTDGIEVVAASMDGRPFPPGDGVNQIEVTGDSKVRVRWRFLPLADSTHVFVLTYRARGVVSQSPEADVLAWRALPHDHPYRIASATAVFEWPHTLPQGTTPIPGVRRHRIDGAVTASNATASEASPPPPSFQARVHALQIRPDGWMEARFAFPPGSILSAPPLWQRARQRARSFAPRWITAGTLITLAGLIVLVGLRQQYDPPPRDQSTMPGSATPPDSLAPGLVGPLLANGRAGLEHAMASLFSLAERGLVTVGERPRGRFGQATFDIRRSDAPARLAGHERTLLALGLGEATAGEAVPLHTVRHHLTRRLRLYTAAVQTDLMEAGLIDPDRQRVRDRYLRVALGMFVLGVLGGAAAVPLLARFDAWPMFVPAALAVVAIMALIFSAGTTPLSNEGVRRAARWRGFRASLKKLSRNREPSDVSGLGALLPLAVATGLGAGWAKYLKRHPGSVPPWFQALSAASQDTAFAAFVTSAGAPNAGAHGAGASGGAAGGGASRAG